jgi:beta-glucosidase
MKIHNILIVLFSIGWMGCSKNIAVSETAEKDDVDQRVELIVSNMSLEEKIGQTCQVTLDVFLKKDENGQIILPLELDSKKVQSAIVDYRIGSVLNVGSFTFTQDQWESVMKVVHKPFISGQTSSPILYGIDAIHGVNYTVGATLFPQQIGLAASWNPDLAYEMGRITAYETRASGIPWNFSPVLDLGRQPLWSRTFETFGEDPFLASKMGVKMVRGYQGENGIDSLHVAACLKHFVGYSNPMSGRDRTPAWIPKKYMAELYLPPFEAAVKSGALTIMVNSGPVNGIPGHENYNLLTKTLKDDWGFKGFVVSDWEDFIMLHTVHRTAATKMDGIVNAINAGLDMSMVPYEFETYCTLIKQAIDENKISMDRLDDAVRRIVRVKILLGLYDDPLIFDANDYPAFNSEEFKTTARKSAIESITLLKNEGILPLDKNKKVLISGPTSNDLIYLNGAWTHTWQGQDNQYNTKGRPTVLEEFKNQFGAENVLFSRGAELYLDHGFENTRLAEVEDFKAKADSADVIVLCLGEMPSTEKPGDIRSLNLDPAQIKLAQMAYQSGKPVVLILLEGRPRIIREIVDSASAIVQGYLPGDFGAEALVALITGEENFSGKLPYTYPKYDGVIEFYDHPRSVDRDKQNAFNAFDPQWEFGFGLSYSTFEYANLSISQGEMSSSDTVRVSVDVTNTSSVKGQEVIQLYLSDHYASMIPAGKKLINFTKEEFGPNETKKIIFSITANDLKFANENGEWILEPGAFGISISNLSVNLNLK